MTGRSNVTVDETAGMHLRLCTDPALLMPDGVRAPLGRKSMALLAYLALEPGVHSRLQLAGLLWPDADEARASMSLRQALAKIKAVIGDALHSDRQHVRLEPASSSAWRCDVTDFLATVESDPLHATTLDVHNFLTPAPVDDAPEFAHWMDRTRESLTRKAMGALRLAARDAAARREWTRAGIAAERWVAIDGLSEEGVSAAVEAAFMRRDPERGRALYKSYEATLRGADDGGGANVSGGSVAALLRRLESVATMTPMRGVPAVRHDVPVSHGAATRFSVALHGRDGAWSTLADAWAHVTRTGTASVLLATGPCGSGRTRLLADAASWISSRGATVLNASSRGMPATLPYVAVTDLLHGALDAPGLGGIDEQHLVTLNQLQPAISKRFPAIRRAAPSGSGAGTPAELTFALRVYEALSQLMEALCEDAPVVIALDDVAWCDRDSAMVLQMLLQRCERLPVLWIATTPSDDTIEHPHGLLNDMMQQGIPIALPPLSGAQVAAMLGEFSGQPSGWDALASRVHAVSHGAPWLVCTAIENARRAAGDTLEALRDAMPDVPRPHPRMTARIDALSDMSRELLLGLSLAVDERAFDSLEDWQAASPVSLDVLSHLHGISRLRAARMGSTLAEGGLALESAVGFRCASPAIASYVRTSTSALLADELRRRLVTLLPA